MDVHATDVIREAIAPRAIKWFLGEETADDDDDDEAFMGEYTPPGTHAPVADRPFLCNTNPPHRTPRPQRE